MKRGAIIIVVILSAILLVLAGCTKAPEAKCPASCDDGDPCTRDSCSKATLHMCLSTIDSNCCKKNDDCKRIGPDYICRDYGCFKASAEELKMIKIGPWYTDYAKINQELDLNYRKAKTEDEYASSVNKSHLDSLKTIHAGLFKLNLSDSFKVWKTRMNSSVSLRIYSVDYLLKINALVVPKLSGEGTEADVLAIVPQLSKYRAQKKEYFNMSRYYSNQSKIELTAAMNSLSK